MNYQLVKEAYALKADLPVVYHDLFLYLDSNFENFLFLTNELFKLFRVGKRGVLL